MAEGSLSGLSRAGSPRPEGRADSLDDLLEWVRDAILRKTAFERVVVAAGFESDVSAVSTGIPKGEAEAFVRTLVADGGNPSDVLSTGGDLPPSSAREALHSMESVVVVAAPAPTTSLVAVAAVDAPPRHPEVADVREIVRDAGPSLFAAAELRTLRAKVGTLESEQQRSRGALDALSDPVLVMDADSRTLLSNQRAEELLVTGPQDSPGRRHAVQTNNLFLSAFRARAILERSGAPRELLLVDPGDGSDLLFEVSAIRHDDSQAFEGESLLVLRDITDLKHAAHELEMQNRRLVAAEHEARRESERLNVIIENAGVPIFVTDRQTNVMLMNLEAERLLEVSRGGQGTSPRLQDIRANDVRLAGLINDFMLHPQLRAERRVTLVDPDEVEEFPAMAVSRKILDDHSETTAVVTVLHDLTQEVENHHLAEELRSFNAELEERVEAATAELAERNAQLEIKSEELQRASRMKSEFLQTMSHELRTPINAVLGYNSLLREGLFGELTKKQEDALRRMRTAAEHLLSLINDILDLSRVEAGKVQLSVADVALAEFLDQLSESVRPMATAKSLEFRLEVAPGTPSIRTDETRLRQVLLNLLTNAVKFTESGAVTVRAGPAEDREAVLLEVEDTGIGIEGDDLEAIFDEFTQVDQTETREHGGTGLGLAISHKLIHLMGGTLDVESERGVGSTFKVDLPVSPPVTWSDAGGTATDVEEPDVAPTP